MRGPGARTASSRPASDLGDQPRRRLEQALGAHRAPGPAAACGTAPARPGSAGTARRGRAWSGVEGTRVVDGTAGAARRPPSHRTGGLVRRRDDVAQVTRRRAACAGPGAGAPWPPTPRCRARRRSPRGAGRRCRAGPRRPAAWAAGVARRLADPLAQVGRARAPASGSCAGSGIVDERGRRRARRGGAGARRPRWVEAQLAVMRYSQVVNCASPRKRLQAPIGPEVGLLHHVACVLLVAGEPVARACRCRRRSPARARRRPPGRRPGGVDQARSDVVDHRLRRLRSRYRSTVEPGG